MAHLVIQNEEQRKEKRFKFKLPPLVGKFGVSFEFGKKQFFLGLSIADVEIETVVKRRKLKVLKEKGSSRFIQL